MTKDLFTLEAINAYHGDSLLLHYGTTESPRHILIDGGTKGVYRNFLRSRLVEIVERTNVPEEKMKLDGVFLTHIDDDHIMGLLDLVEDLQKKTAPCVAPWFWFNAFEDLMTTLPAELASLDTVYSIPASRRLSTAALESVRQGRSLRDGTRALGARINFENGKLLMADKTQLTLLKRDNIMITLIAPSKTRTRALYDDWQKKSALAKNKDEQAAALAAYTDTSIYNLSSLVLVVETISSPKKRMLLTGDARGDDIIAGLKMAGLLTNGKAHFDLLKMPHHGSNRNMSKKFLSDITADNYVISADGRHDNPDRETLEWLSDVRGAEDVHLYFTNDSNRDFPNLEKNMAKLRSSIEPRKVRVRKTQEYGVAINLLTEIPF